MLELWLDSIEPEAMQGGDPNQQTAAGDPTEAVGTLSPAERKAGWLGKALMLKAANPEMPNAEIARKVGVHPAQLTPKRCPPMASLEAMQQNDTTSGYLKKDADSGLSDVEAAAPADDKSDHGEKITGSEYYREYCTGCDEPMRVTQDKVGTRPRCDDCGG